MMADKIKGLGMDNPTLAVMVLVMMLLVSAALALVVSKKCEGAVSLRIAGNVFLIYLFMGMLMVAGGMLLALAAWGDQCGFPEGICMWALLWLMGDLGYGAKEIIVRRRRHRENRLRHQAEQQEANR
jgi:small-conductance mechanosensitive channel